MIRSRVLVGVLFATIMTGTMGPAVLAKPPSDDPTAGLSPSVPRYDPVAEYRAGVTALQTGKFRDAITAFDNVLEVAPADTNSLFLKGMAQTGLNDFRGAQRSYQAAVRSNSRMPAPHRELGLTYIKLGRKPDAQKEREALQALAVACKDTCPDAAELKSSLATLDAALAGTPGPGALLSPGPLFGPSQGDGAYLRAVSLINQGRYRDAIGSLEGAQLAFGPHPDVLTYLGFSYRKLRLYDQAESYYKQALAVAPNHLGATEYYGELKVERGDLAGARQMLARLDRLCAFACPEAEELRRWIDGGPRL